MKKNIIRVGDKVRIAKPYSFVRCGYPLTKEDMLRTRMSKEDAYKISKFLEDFGIHEIPFYTEKPITKAVYSRVYDRVADAVAYGLLESEKYGGRERKIFTQYHPHLQDAEAVVIGRKVVNTGRYVPGYGPCYPDYESEGPSLTNQQSHVILRVEVKTVPDIEYGIIATYKLHEQLEFEKENLVKLC